MNNGSGEEELIQNKTKVIQNKTRVVHCKKESYDVLIDRRTKYGNPFILGRNGTREEVIAKHREKVLNDPVFIKIIKKELTGKILGCWCKPKACHGDTYKEICDDYEY